MCQIDGLLLFELYKGTTLGTVVEHLQYFWNISWMSILFLNQQLLKMNWIKK